VSVDNNPDCFGRGFIVLRGVPINAGGDAESDSDSFHWSAEIGLDTCGILSNKYLDESCKTMKHILNVNIQESGSFSYKGNIF